MQQFGKSKDVWRVKMVMQLWNIITEIGKLKPGFCQTQFLLFTPLGFLFIFFFFLLQFNFSQDRGCLMESFTNMVK